MHIECGAGEAQWDPIFMTEVNVDRSKPCSHSAVIPLVTGYLLYFHLGVVFMIKLGISAGSVLLV